MSKRAVLYARVSGDDTHRDGRNLKGQLDACRKFALDRGYTIVAELSEDDRGASGASFDLPQLNHVLEMAKAREFDVVVVREIDRFSRRLAKQLIIETELKRSGVQIEYVLDAYPDTPEGNLNKNIKAVIAEYERLKITERMVRGRRQKATHGSLMLHGAPPPLGYTLVLDGRNERLEINEAAAKGIRLIYQWYVVGDPEGRRVSVRKITTMLNEAQVYHPNGRWSRTTVNRILATETYAGVWHYGKYGWRDGKRFLTPRSHWIAVEVPAIIERDFWNAAVARRKQAKEDALRNQKYPYLLAKRVTCGVCQSRMSVSGENAGNRKGELYLFYRCPAANKRYVEYTCVCDHVQYYRAPKVDALVWEWVRSLLVDPAQLAEGIEAYFAAKEEDLAPVRDRLATIETLLADNIRQLERLLDLYLKEDFPRDVLIERRQRLENTIQVLTQERNTLVAQVADIALTDAQLQNLKALAAQIAEGLDEADNSFELRRGIIELLDVRVTFTIENEQRVAIVTCAFGYEKRLLLPQPSCMRTSPENHSPAPARRLGHAARTGRRR